MHFKPHLTFIPFLVLAGCKSINSFNNEKKLEEVMLTKPSQQDYNLKKPADYNNFISRVNAFSAKFTSSVIDRMDGYENIAVSPVSVYFALAMTAESVGGEDREEILSALGVDINDLHENIPYFYNRLNVGFFEHAQQYGQIHLTNSIWIQDGYNVKQTILDTLSDIYKSYVFQVNFKNETKKANELIRNFIKKETNNLIDKDLNCSEFTRLVLLNTLYFKDTWNSLGTELLKTNKKYKFNNLDNTVSELELLKGYYKVGRQYVCEEYKSFYTSTFAGYKISFIVPNDGYNVTQLMSSENINNLLERQYIKENKELNEEYYTRCLFPEYECNYDSDIKNILEDNFGIYRIFNKYGANFTPTVVDPNTQNLYVDKVQHVAKLKVEAKGVEGAAITAVVVDTATAAPPDEEPVKIYEEFIVDKSFGYVVSNDNGAIFSGIVSKV